MTKEEKELLFRNLCARLPYGVKCRQRKLDSQICTMYPEYLRSVEDVEEYEPYLRSLSNMTYEESIELDELAFQTETCGLYNYLGLKPNFFGIIASKEFDKSITNSNVKGASIDDVITYVDWLNLHHFDYMKLIKKGLALEAPEGMYNN